MKKRRALFTAFISLALSFGCATMSDVVKAKAEGKGTTKVYPVGFDQAWEISKTVLRWEGADAIEEHRDRGYMLTSSGMNLVSYGAVMGAWIGKIDGNQSRVTIITKRRIAVNLATTLTESTFHKRFQEALEIVQSGRPLPSERPKQKPSNESEPINQSSPARSDT